MESSGQLDFTATEFYYPDLYNFRQRGSNNTAEKEKDVQCPVEEKERTNRSFFRNNRPCRWGGSHYAPHTALCRYFLVWTSLTLWERCFFFSLCEWIGILSSFLCLCVFLMYVSLAYTTVKEGKDYSPAQSEANETCWTLQFSLNWCYVGIICQIIKEAQLSGELNPKFSFQPPLGIKISPSGLFSFSLLSSRHKNVRV